MAKKYKNTVHKNPFREDRPKKKIPWMIIGIICGILALILIMTLIINALLGVRKLSLTENGGFYDRRSGITYFMAPFCYQPVTIIKKDVFATYNDTKFYEIQDISTEKMITTAEEKIYEIYYNKDYPLPTLSEMKVNSAIICDVEIAVYPVGFIDSEDVNILLELLSDKSIYCDYPQDTNDSNVKYIYFTSPDYPYLYYYIHFIKTSDGTRYIYDSSNRICVPIGDALKDIIE